MNTPNSDASIDRLLRDWADGQQPDATRADLLRSQVLDALKESSTLKGDARPAADVVPSPARTVYRWRVLGPCVAMAALLLVAFTAYLLRTVPAPPPSGAVRAAPITIAALKSQELRSRGRLFREFDDLYDGRVLWMAEVNDRIEVGLDREAPSVSAGQPVVVRLVLMTRPRDDRDWIPQEQVDVMARTDQVVDVALPQNPVDRLTLWIHRLPDGRLMVDTNLDGPALGRSDRRTSHIFGANVGKIIEHGVADGQQWRVSQAVAMAQ